MIHTTTATSVKLTDAQRTALQVFEIIEKEHLVVAGKTEALLAAEIFQLSFQGFGIKDHWHKKIVRSGINTLAVYRENPPDRTILADDIVFIDLGPIVDGYEADLGRTYVLGNDPAKQKIKQDVEKAWYEIQAWYRTRTNCKASELFQLAVEKAWEYGWTFAGEIAGHIVGKYPHEQPADPNSVELDIHPDNHNDIFLLDAEGKERHWILELQFVDKEKGIGAYFEQLL